MHFKLLWIFITVSAGWSVSSIGVHGFTVPKHVKETKQPWGLYEALEATSRIRGFNGTWISDEEFYYTANDFSIHKYNALTNVDSEFVKSSFLQKYGPRSTFTLSPDNTKILVRYEVEEIFRHSFIAKYDVYDIKEDSPPIEIHKGNKLQYCSWSPIRDRLAYVYDNNVYIHFEDGLEPKITNNGVNGVIYNGIPDWVYEEEVLSSGSALWWSPDGLKLAIGTFDDTAVQTFKYFLYGDAENPEYQYPKEVDLQYPKAGTPNPKVALRIYDLGREEPMLVTITAPTAIVSNDHILQNVVWSDNQNLLITWLNRRQNISSLQSCDSLGQCREVLRIEEPEGWVTIGTPQCRENGINCIFTYWIDNWYQVWNLNIQTGANLGRSLGDLTVLRVYGYDEINDKLYYQATLKDDPSQYHIYSNYDCLTCDMKDADGALCRSAAAAFSTKYSYYTVVCSGPNPSYTKIFSTKTNTEVKLWVDNAAFRELLETKLRPDIEFLNVTLADGSWGYAKLQFPPNMDKTKKYPMIVYVYGGPNSVRVTNGFTVGFDAYMTTNREVIYVLIDGRGTGNKGKKLLFSVNNNLGEHEVEDQIFVTKFLTKRFDFIDTERIGIWGWSYGGYMTAKTIGNDTNRVFQCGISVAPVTSWLYYDTIYTERYMGLPTVEDNLSKYIESSVFPGINNFRTHEFMLIHGSGDDNVHYQQSLVFAKILQKNDILFEEMAYTDENHSIGNYLRHLYNTMDHFWINCLNLEVDDYE